MNSRHHESTESIGIQNITLFHTLMNNSIKNDIYIDFGRKITEKLYNGYNLTLLDSRLKEHDLISWLKYQDLKRKFEKWCDLNLWIYDEWENF